MASPRCVLRVKWGCLVGLGARLRPALETAGVSILITSVGGAFGGMLKPAGVGVHRQGIGKLGPEGFAFETANAWAKL